MAGRINCNSCGGKVVVPAGHSRAKIRCNHFGYYAEVPPDQRSTLDEDGTPATAAPALEVATAKTDTSVKKKKKVKRAADPRDNRPQFEDEEPTGPYLLEGTQDEDDDKPYAVPGDGTKLCPDCRVKLPLDAKQCVHCGIDLITKKKPKKSYEPIEKEWEPRFPLLLRLKVIAALQLVNVLMALYIISGANSPFFAFVSLLIQGGLQAFLVGTFQMVGVKRTADGQVTITKTWRIAFIRINSVPVAWKKSHGMGIIATYDPGLLEWFTLVYLLLLFLIPGILFYWFIIRPERFEVALCDMYGSTDDILFRTTNREEADDVCNVISNCSGLMYKSVV